MNAYPEIEDKLMTLEEAVRRFVKDGSQIALGGFTVTRSPMAVAYEIVRQRIKDLHIVCHSPGQAFDVLIGAGCVKRVEARVRRKRKVRTHVHKVQKGMSAFPNRI